MLLGLLRLSGYCSPSDDGTNVGHYPDYKGKVMKAGNVISYYGEWVIIVEIRDELLFVRFEEDRTNRVYVLI